MPGTIVTLIFLLSVFMSKLTLALRERVGARAFPRFQLLTTGFSVPL
jgi:hypothetical protein